MIADSARSSLVDALAKYTGRRGGQPADLLHVVQVDDLDAGAYAGSRRWAITVGIGALAANTSYVFVYNQSEKGIAVIDRLDWATTVANNIYLGYPWDSSVGGINAGGAESFFGTSVAELGKRTFDGVTVTRLFDVRAVGVQSVTGLSTVLTLQSFGVGQNTIERLGLVIPPKCAVSIAPTAVNIGLTATVWGKFYEAS